MDILAKFGIRYCKHINSEMINEFVLQNLEDFSEVFFGLAHPLEAANYFAKLSEERFGSNIKHLQNIIQTTTNNIESFEKDITKVRNDLAKHEDISLFRRLFIDNKFKKVANYLHENIEQLEKSIQKNIEEKEKAMQALREMETKINYWEIFHEAAMNAYAELVSINPMHRHLDLRSFSIMREYYLSAEGLSEIHFDMQTFLSDGVVNTVFALSDSPMDTNGCTVAQAINKLCNIKTADHLVRKHIFTKLLGSGINVSLLASSSQPQPVIG